MSCLENLHINSRHVSDFYCPQRSRIDTAIDDTLACHFFSHIFQSDVKEISALPVGDKRRS